MGFSQDLSCCFRQPQNQIVTNGRGGVFYLDFSKHRIKSHLVTDGNKIEVGNMDTPIEKKIVANCGPMKRNGINMAYKSPITMWNWYSLNEMHNYCLMSTAHHFAYPVVVITNMGRMLMSSSTLTVISYTNIFHTSHHHVNSNCQNTYKILLYDLFLYCLCF